MNLRKLMLGVGAVCLLSFPLLAQNAAPYYVLDGYGGVHAGGGAPTISPSTPYFGWDIAKAVQFVPVASSSSNYGDGIFVLDGYGGIHKGGKLSGVTTTPNTPYWGWNIARDLVYRIIDPQAYGAYSSSSSISISSSTKTVLVSFYINMPDAGYALLTASAGCWNPSAYDIAVRYGIGIDSDTTHDQGTERWNAMPTGYIASTYECDMLNTSRLISLTAGQHYFYFLAWRSGGTGTASIAFPTLMAVYINKDYRGYSRVVEPENSEVMPAPASQPSTAGVVK